MAATALETETIRSGMSGPASERELQIARGDGKDSPTEGFEPILPGLTEALEKELIGLVKSFERESYITWRGLQAKFLKAEAFWKDIHHGYYDEDRDIWTQPSIQQLQSVGETGSRFNYHTNLYRAWGWSLISVLGQKVPKTRFLPANFQDPHDVMAADASSDAAPLIERNNKVNLLNIRASYLFYTHGVCASHTRFLADKQRFGYRTEPILGVVPTQIMESGYDCPECMEFTPADEGELFECPKCGAPLSESDFAPPVEANAPQVVGTREVPNGQEVITIYGGLELRLPPWTREERDWPYLGIANEVHAARLRAAYGKRARGLHGGESTADEETWDRYARLSLMEPSVAYFASANKNLVTVKSYWLRPDAFQMIDKDEERNQLLELFPDGVKVVFTGGDSSKLLDAQSEKLDDHWEVAHALEGAGNYTPSLGEPAISINERFNTFENFIMEWLEYAAAGAGTFVNVGLLNITALTKHRRAPGNIYPLKLPPNVTLANAVHEGRTGQIAGEVFMYQKRLENLGQTLTGAVPSLSGGTEMSLKPTTYLADREQAIGRLYVPWSNLRVFWSNTILKAVREFGRYRTQDEYYSLPGINGKPDNRIIRLDELDGQFKAFPETDESFPVLFHEMQAIWMKLMESQDEFVQEIMGHSKNIPLGKAMFGLPDVYVPRQDDRVKQELEIQALLQQAPVIDALPDGTFRTVPSVLIGEFEDDHNEHVEAVKEWAVSPGGLKAKASNPQGYANVIAHGKMHEDFLKLQAVQDAQMVAAAQPALLVGKQKKPKPAAKATGTPPAEKTKEVSERIEKEV